MFTKVPLSISVHGIYPGRVRLFHKRIPILGWTARKDGGERGTGFWGGKKPDEHTQSSGRVRSSGDTFRNRIENPAMGGGEVIRVDMRSPVSGCGSIHL